MKRRDFLSTLAASGLIGQTSSLTAADEPAAADSHDHHHHHDHATYATPAEAMKAPPERFAFVPAILTGTGSKHPDYMATVDVDPDSKTYGQVVGRFPMPAVGDELHHYGWNACSSCHGERQRRYLVVPGLAS